MAVIGILANRYRGRSCRTFSAPRAPSTGTLVAQSDTPTATSADQGAASPTEVACHSNRYESLAARLQRRRTRVRSHPTNTRIPPTATPIGVFSHSGTISNVDTSAHTFTLTRTGGPYTVNWAGAHLHIEWGDNKLQLTGQW